MTKIYLVRHTDYDESKGIMPGRLPVPLSENGLRQAEKLKEFFKDTEIDTIYSSAVLRCKQTSEIISGGKTPIVYDQRLLESFSAFQGYWEIDWKQFWGHRHELGGEDNQQIYDRMADFFNSIKWQDNKNYIICSHGDPLYFLYQYIDKQELLPTTELGDISIEYPGYQSRGSVRILTKDSGEWKVTDYLEQMDL